MLDIKETKKLLDDINAAVSSYDPLLKEQARDILLKQAFGTEFKTKTLGSTKGDVPDGGEKNHTAFHELVEKWTPTTHWEWALLGAYYFQVILDNENITAFQVNKELKQHGTTVSNITVAFGENITQTPALMRQIKKAGKTKQAKKKYIVTTNGIQFVKEKLDGQTKS